MRKRRQAEQGCALWHCEYNSGSLGSSSSLSSSSSSLSSVSHVVRKDQTMMSYALIQVLLFFIPFCLGQNGKWTEDAEGCIRGRNDWVGTASSFQACQLSCESQDSFTCLSIDYMDGHCKHSRHNRHSVRPTGDFTQPCYTGDSWHYAERLDVDYPWTDIVYGCIRGNNDGVGTTTDILSCQKRCEDETSFVCLSVDYNDGDCHLSRFNRDSIRPTEDYTQPCYVAGCQYSERRHLGRCSKSPISMVTFHISTCVS
ncbi:hypothetical protein BSL78_20244 [Apostichopus japonicus]|uniref:Apple domain-containing protein n=1 Tax=Stichopus japonicus TaxID=307972 RepID=A0A2G8K4G4_STIJA|nr:hypothetical protein BSL78_20244 [Apostichopus japonicus]